MRIIYFDLDSTRPDHLGCYGYSRPTSPTIDAMAAEGVRFTNCYTSDAPCQPSRTALFSGRFGIHTGVVGHAGTAAQMRFPGDGHVADPTRLPWAMAMSRQGMRTASFSTFAPRHLAWYFNAGWTEVHVPSLKGGNEIASEVNAAVLPWLHQHGGEDSWFLHVNYWDPHTPYRTPESYDSPLTGDPLPAWLDDDVLARQWESYGAMSARDRSRTEPAGMRPRDPARWPRVPRQLRKVEDARAWIDAYDIGIRYADDHVAQVLDVLAELGVVDECAVIISADHGENQGELNIYGDHQTADHWTSRVPLIMRWPGVTPSGEVNDALVYQQDVPPAVCELLGFEPPSGWDGRSLAPALRGESFEGRSHVVFGQGAWTCQRAVRFGPWLAVRTLHPGLHPFPATMLYNVDEDPHETKDLASSRPDLVAQADSLLLDWWYQMMTPTEAAPDPLLTVIEEGGPYYVRARWTDFVAGLRDDGQAWAADELEGRRLAVRPDDLARALFGGPQPQASSS